ncbi:MAG: GEVED domain-containing protein, partial [Flavobacteriales bacterium]|nr:GEVED domain-containing protein [Flavobacteriales bacterium]
MMHLNHKLRIALLGGFLNLINALYFFDISAQGNCGQINVTHTQTNVSCNGGNDGAINITVTGGSAVTGSPAPACLPTYSQPCANCPSTWDHINHVYTQGAACQNITNMNSGCQATLPNNYVNTGMEVITTAGSSFTLFMQAATSASGCFSQYAQGFAVWADWNNNGNLTDPGELLMTFPSSFNLNSGTVTVPANQPPGRYRLRVRCTYATIPTGPCTAASYGETEDYVIAVVGPPPTLTYSWTGPNGFAANTEDISGLVAGTYNLTITGAGQPIQYSVTITQPPAVAAPSASNVNICPGQSATLTASGSTGQYNWYSDAQGTNLVGTGASITIPNVTQSSTYYVQAVSGTCTSALTPVQILFNPSPTVSITGDNTVCLGATFTLDGSGSSVQAPSVINQYAWDFNSDGTVDFTSASPTASHSVNQAGT